MDPRIDPLTNGQNPIPKTPRTKVPASEDPTLPTAPTIDGLRSRDLDVRIATAVSLKGTTDPVYQKMLCKLLTHKDKYVRIASAAALKGTNNRGCLKGLCELLHDPDYDVRRAGVYALAGTTSQKCIKELCDLVFREETNVQEAALGAIGTTNERIIDLLRKRLSSAPNTVRSSIIRDFIKKADKLNNPRTERDLLHVIRTSDHIGESEEAAAALAQTKDPFTLGIVSAMRNSCTAIILAGRTEPAYLETLCAMLKYSAGAHTNLAAIKALKGTKDPQCQEALCGLLSHDWKDIRVAAAEALKGTTAPKTLQFLCDFVLNVEKSDYNRILVISALEGTTDPKCLEALQGLAVQANRSHVGTAALKVLTGIVIPPNDRRAHFLYQKIITDKPELPNGSPIDRSAVDAHRTLEKLRHSDSRVSVPAIQDLNGTTDSASLSMLYDMLVDESVGYHAKCHVVTSLAHKIDDPKFVKAIREQEMGFLSSLILGERPDPWIFDSA